MWMIDNLLGYVSVLFQRKRCHRLNLYQQQEALVIQHFWFGHIGMHATIVEKHSLISRNANKLYQAAMEM
jgi:hypothetical protein